MLHRRSQIEISYAKGVCDHSLLIYFVDGICVKCMAHDFSQIINSTHNINIVQFYKCVFTMSLRIYDISCCYH